MEETYVKYYVWSMALCGAGMWALREVDKKYVLHCYMFRPSSGITVHIDIYKGRLMDRPLARSFFIRTYRPKHVVML